MSEFKTGLYRIEGLIEVVVFYASHDVAWFSVGSNSNPVREHWSSFSNRKPEYLGPAVIGATAKDILATLPPPIDYSVDEDGIECWRFDTVTVMRREGKEFYATQIYDLWRTYNGTNGLLGPDNTTRERAEAWCRAQLKPPEPKWRPAKTDGSDNGKQCRVKDCPESDWRDRQVIGYYAPGSVWVCGNGDVGGALSSWKFCEVKE